MFDALFRIEYPKLIAGLVRITRDVGIAEDLAQDALVAAMETWPRDGTPDNPGAWLMTTARNRALDRVRRSARFPHEALVVEPAAPAQAYPVVIIFFSACFAGRVLSKYGTGTGVEGRSHLAVKI